MPRRPAHFQMAPTEYDLVAVVDIAIGTRGAGLRGKRDRAAELLLQQPSAGHVISMHVRVDGGDQLEVELAQQRGVAARLLEHRIDQHRVPRACVTDQIRVRRRRRIERLAEDQKHAGSSDEARCRYSLAAARGSPAGADPARPRSAHSKTSIPASIATTNTT